MELQGFEPVIISRDKSLNFWLFGNILFGGLIGLAIDSATGNANKFDDDPIAVGFGTNLPPGPESDPRVIECKKEQASRIQKALKLTDKSARIQALRRARCQ